MTNKINTEVSTSTKKTRKRLTKKEEQENRTLLKQCIKKNCSSKVLHIALGVTKAKLAEYIATLAGEGFFIDKKIDDHSLLFLNELQASIKEFFSEEQEERIFKIYKETEDKIIIKSYTISGYLKQFQGKI